MPASVPNQRNITVHKAKADKQHLYTPINLNALDNAVNRLKSLAGIKLFLYIAKNQDKYNFYLSSSDFMAWAGVGRAAYNSAFDELVKEGFLIKKFGDTTTYYFYEDLTEGEEEKDNQLIIEASQNRMKELEERYDGFKF